MAFTREERRRYYREHPELRARYQRRWQRRHPERAAANARRWRARQRRRDEIVAIKAVLLAKHRLRAVGVRSRLNGGFDSWAAGVRPNP